MGTRGDPIGVWGVGVHGGGGRKTRPFQRQTRLITPGSGTVVPMPDGCDLADPKGELHMATSAHVLAFNRALSQARDTAKRAHNDVRALSAKRKEINKIGKLLAGCLDSTDTLSLAVVCDKPIFYLALRNLPSFKCMHLESTLWLLEELGKCTRTKEWAEYLNKEFMYEIDGATVYLNAYVKSDSPVCRKVPDGTETVIKYKLECD